MTEDEAKLEMALRLYSEARLDEYMKLSREVYDNTTDAFSKLQAINFLTSSMNKVEHNKELLELCGEGIELSEQLGMADAKANYLALKAECLMYRCMVLQYKMRNFKIAPGWQGFALESHSSEHTKFSAKASKYERKANNLLAEALEIAESTSNRIVLVRTLRSLAFLQGIQRTIFIISGNQKYSGLFLFFLNNFSIQLTFLRKNKKEIRKAEENCRSTLLRALDIAKSAGEESECAYILFSLVGEVNTFGRKREAKKYLRIAEKLAYKVGEKILIRQALLLKKTVNEKITKEYYKPPNFGDSEGY